MSYTPRRRFESVAMTVVAFAVVVTSTSTTAAERMSGAE